jgi:hypothetical protein
MGRQQGLQGERRQRRRVFVLLFGSVLSIFLGIIVGIALWAASGSGPGSAKVVTAQTLTVTAAVSPTADLFPGGSGALQFSVANPNPYPVTLTSIAYGAVTSGDQANCPASNLTPAGGGALGTPIAIPANGSSGAVSVPAAVTLSVNAPNGCQGVTLTVAVTLTGSQT